ncbi:MAG: hypothetical protein CMP23_02910 [Rickettsiales bacterium]|nr:hypothetical protein [Rickettsiales bacterium]
MSALDQKISELALRYRPLAAEILAETIRIPADYVDRSPEAGGDPACGLSNHEGPRLEYLRRMIVEHDCVADPADVDFDEFGNLAWTVLDPDDPTPVAERRIIYFDGHTDTVKALRDQWSEKVGAGMDAYDGLTDSNAVDVSFLRRELGHLPPDEEWEHMLFGRGAADQLGGVIAQLIATKILVELCSEGSLRGVVVRSFATVAEEDNDGGGPMYFAREVWPHGGAEQIPDVVILTEGTGDAAKGALGIYRGQRGRMQIELKIIGRSCHGSMPWEGLNPLEYGGAIVAEAAARYEAREGFLDHEFLGHGTRTASWARLETPSDCAVPDTFTVRFDRRLTFGESPAQAVADVEALDGVERARKAGLTVEVSIPEYDEPTWRGYVPGNPQVYPGWMTPEDHPAIQAAVDAYQRVVSPHVVKETAEAGSLSKHCRVDRWIFSTDGVGFPIPSDDTTVAVPESKRWVDSGPVRYPAMFGCGPGIEQNTHKIGECVDLRELQHAIAMLSRFPSLFAAEY